MPAKKICNICFENVKIKTYFKSPCCKCITCHECFLNSNKVSYVQLLDKNNLETINNIYDLIITNLKYYPCPICKKDREIAYDETLSTEQLLDNSIISLVGETILYIHEQELKKVMWVFEFLFENNKKKIQYLYASKNLLDEANKNINVHYTTAIDLIDNFNSDINIKDIKDTQRCEKCELCVIECIKVDDLLLCKLCIKNLYYDFVVKE